jgi:hypothetical protein
VHDAGADADHPASRPTEAGLKHLRVAYAQPGQCAALGHYLIQFLRAERDGERTEEKELRAGPGFFGREYVLSLAKGPAQLVLGGRRAEQLGCLHRAAAELSHEPDDVGGGPGGGEPAPRRGREGPVDQRSYLVQAARPGQGKKPAFGTTSLSISPGAEVSAQSCYLLVGHGHGGAPYIRCQLISWSANFLAPARNCSSS